MALRRVGLLVALHKAGVSEAIKQLVALLEISSVEVVMPKEVAELLGRSDFVPVEELANVDIIIALGGDGCILSAARIAAPKDVPILGIRIRGFGFLAEVELEHVDDALNKLFANDFWLDERAMLQVELWHGDTLIWSAVGLNDAVILKSPNSPLPVWEVFVDGDFLARYPADGVAVATPTGSTAYTLSAGGPILAFDVDAFLLMPMYAHTLMLRPLVFPSRAKVTVQLLPQRRPVEGKVSVDGQVSHQVLPNHRLSIFKAPMKARIVRFHRSSFYERLRQKLHWGERQ